MGGEGLFVPQYSVLSTWKRGGILPQNIKPWSLPSRRTYYIQILVQYLPRGWAMVQSKENSKSNIACWIMIASLLTETRPNEMPALQAKLSNWVGGLDGKHLSSGPSIMMESQIFPYLASVLPNDYLLVLQI